MKITISGASGLIGGRLRQVLTQEGHTVTTLGRKEWNVEQSEPPTEFLREADAVIHLAGTPVAQRWSAAAKQSIRESRVVGTRNLVRALGKLPRRPQVLICASAVGYYGSRGDEVLTEDSAAGSDFLAEVCVAWEEEAVAAEALGMRVVRVRTGVVLDAHGGALARMLPPFCMGVGGRLGDGRHWMSWIHLDDLAGMMQFALAHPVSGAMNAVSPNPVTNAEFTKALAGAVHRPAIFPVPGFGLKLLFGEMAGILLASQRATPKAAELAGFRFRHPDLGEALADLLR